MGQRGAGVLCHTFILGLVTSPTVGLDKRCAVRAWAAFDGPATRLFAATASLSLLVASLRESSSSILVFKRDKALALIDGK